jgi:hypothetical protein
VPPVGGCLEKPTKGYESGMGAAEARSERYESSPVQIAHALKTRGEYVARVERAPHQRLVDVQWTAYRAARLLGIRVSFVLDVPAHADDPFVTLTVSPHAQGRRQA